MMEKTRHYAVPTYLLFALATFSPVRELIVKPSIGELLIPFLAPWVIWKTLTLKYEKLPIWPVFMIPALGFMFASAAAQEHTLKLTAYKMPMMWMGHLIIYLLIYHWLIQSPEKRLRILQSTFLLFAKLLAFVCIIQMVIGPSLSAALMPWGPEWTKYYEGLGFRTYGLLDNPLLLGTALVMSYPIALHRLHTSKKKLGPSFGLLLISVGILFSGSRSILLITAIVTVLNYLPRLKPSMLFMASVPFFAVVIAVLLSPFGERFLNLLENGGDKNLLNRTAAAEAGFAMISDAPILGIGPGQFSEVYAQYYKPIHSQDDPSAFTLDNLVFQIAAECGLPAATLLLFGFLIILITTKDFNDLNLSLSLLAFALASLGVALYATPILWLFLSLVAAVEVTAKTTLKPSLRTTNPIPDQIR